MLVFRNNYAKFKEIRTRTITVQGSRGDSKKAKLFITLERSNEFFDNMKKFNEIKEENERLAATAGEGDKKDTKEWKIDKWNTPKPSRMFGHCQELIPPPENQQDGNLVDLGGELLPIEWRKVAFKPFQRLRAIQKILQYHTTVGSRERLRGMGSQTF